MPDRTEQMHREYRTADGQRVPSVTTVLRVMGNESLVRWAGRMGLQGIDPEEVARSSARAGTLAHATFSAALNGDVLVPSMWEECSEEEKRGARMAWRNFVAWRERHEVEPILVEHAMISETMRVGGTLDCYALVDGVPTVLDFKTTARVYDNHFIQVAAYRAMLEELGHPVDAVGVVPLPRDRVRPVPMHLEEDTSLYLEVFLAARALHEAQYRMEHRVPTL